MESRSLGGKERVIFESDDFIREQTLGQRAASTRIGSRNGICELIPFIISCPAFSVSKIFPRGAEDRFLERIVRKLQLFSAEAFISDFP